METGGIALAIPGDGDTPLCDNLTHCTSSPETSKRFAGLVESLAHCRSCGVVERNVLGRNTIHRDLPKTYERERESVSQSPRLEARFGDEIRLVSRKDRSSSKLLTYHFWHS